MNWLNSPQSEIIIKNMRYGKPSVIHWNNALKSIQNNKVRTWDLQWYFSMAPEGQLGIVAKYNLIANIAFGKCATHTFGESKKSYLATAQLNFTLIHHSYIVNNVNYNNRYEELSIEHSGLKRMIPTNIKQFIKRSIHINH